MGIDKYGKHRHLDMAVKFNDAVKKAQKTYDAIAGNVLSSDEDQVTRGLEDLRDFVNDLKASEGDPAMEDFIHNLKYDMVNNLMQVNYHYSLSLSLQHFYLKGSSD